MFPFLSNSKKKKKIKSVLSYFSPLIKTRQDIKLRQQNFKKKKEKQSQRKKKEKTQCNQ
jgi:hypothetical protein